MEGSWLLLGFPYLCVVLLQLTPKKHAGAEFVSTIASLLLPRPRPLGPVPSTFSAPSSHAHQSEAPQVLEGSSRWSLPDSGTANLCMWWGCFCILIFKLCLDIILLLETITRIRTV